MRHSSFAHPLAAAFVTALFTATASADLDVLFEQDFQGTAEGSAGGVVLAVPRSTSGSGAWYRYRARPWASGKDTESGNESITLATGDTQLRAHWIASPEVSGNIGVLTFRTFLPASTAASPTTPHLSLFMGPRNDYTDVSAWPVAGVTVLEDSIPLDTTQTGRWVTHTYPLNFAIDPSTPQRIFLGRMYSDPGYDVLIDDIRLLAAESLLNIEQDLAVTENVDAVQANGTVTPVLSYTTFGTVTNATVTLYYRTSGGTWQTRPFDVATTNAATGVISYTLQGTTVNVGAESGVQLEMYPLATFDNETGAKTVASAYTAENPLRIDILPKSAYANHDELAITGAFQVPMSPTTNGVWVGGIERSAGVSGSGFRFDFGPTAAQTYGLASSSIPFNNTMKAREDCPAPSTLDRDVMFRFSEAMGINTGVAQYGEYQPFENWETTQANGWSLQSTGGTAQVVADAATAQAGTSALYLAAGDSLVLTKSIPGINEMGFWMRRADGAGAPSATLYRHRQGQPANDLLATYTGRPTDRYAFFSFALSNTQSPMVTDGITITALTPIYLDGVYAADSSTASIDALTITPDVLRQNGTASVVATFNLFGGAKFYADEVKIMWGQGHSAAAATNEIIATAQDPATWTAEISEIDRDDADLYVYVTAIARDWNNRDIGTLTSEPQCIPVLPYTALEGVDVLRTVAGETDATGMRLAGDRLWKGAIPAPTAAQANPSYQFRDSNGKLYGNNAVTIPVTTNAVEGEVLSAESVSTALAFEYNEGAGTFRAQMALYQSLTNDIPAAWARTGQVATSPTGTVFQTGSSLTSPERNGIGQVTFWAKRAAATPVTYTVTYSVEGSVNNFRPLENGTGTISGETLRFFSVMVGDPNARKVRIAFSGGAALVQDVVVTQSGSFVLFSADTISVDDGATFIAGASPLPDDAKPTVPYGGRPVLRINASPENGADNVAVTVEAYSLSVSNDVVVTQVGGRTEVTTNHLWVVDSDATTVPMEGDSHEGGLFEVMMPALTAGPTGYRFVATYSGEDATQSVYPEDGLLVYETEGNLADIRTPDFSKLSHNPSSTTTPSGSTVDNWRVIKGWLNRISPNTVGFNPTGGVTIVRSWQAFNGIGRIYFKARAAAEQYATHVLGVEVSEDGNNWEELNNVIVPFGVFESEYTQFCIEVYDYGMKYVRFVRRSTSDDPACYIYMYDVLVTPPAANITLDMPSIIHPGYPSQNDPVTFRVDVANVYDEYPAVNFRPILHWRRVFGSVAQAWKESPMTSTDGAVYTVTLPAMDPGRVEYFVETRFSGASYRYEYDPRFPVKFYYAGDDGEIEDGDPRHGNESSSPSYLMSARSNPDEFSIITQQRPLEAPGEYENLFLWFKVRAFLSHHREFQFVYTDSEEEIATVHTNALRLVGDETWLATISVTNDIHFSGDLLGVAPYSGADAYGEEPDIWGDASQMTTNPPFASKATVDAENPIEIKLGTTNTINLMVRLDTTTGDYQVRRAAYQDFNDWSADQTFFEDSLGLYDTKTYEQAFDGSAQFPETAMNNRVMNFFADTPAASMQDTTYTSFGWRLYKGRILQERVAESTGSKVANKSAEIWPNSGYLENDSTVSANADGLDYVRLKYRSSFGGDGRLPYYKNGFDWDNYIFGASNVVVSSMSPANPYIQIVAAYQDEDNYVAMRLTQLQDLEATDGGRRVKQELIKVSNGHEDVLRAQFVNRDNKTYNLGKTSTSNVFNNIELTSGKWWMILSITNNSVEGLAYNTSISPAVTNKLYATGAAPHGGGTVSFDVYDADVNFGSLGVAHPDGTKEILNSNKFNLGGVQTGGSNTRWRTGGENSPYMTRPVPPLPFTIAVCKAGESASFPGGGTYETVYNGNAGSLGWSTASQAVHYWGNAFVRIAPQKSDARLVVDDVEVQSWRGRSLPEDSPNDDRYWQAREAVVVTRSGSRQLALTTSRANPAARQMISTPEMLEGIGTISFNYAASGGKVVFAVERNTVSGAYADDAGYSQVGDTITAIDGERGEIFRAIRQDMTGKIRVRVLQEESDPDATLYLDNFFAKSFPPDDGRSWTAYNTLIVAPTRNRLTDAIQFEEDVTTQTAFLNNSVDGNTRQNEIFVEHLPYIQSPVIDTGIGEIGFWYRAFNPAHPNPGRITLWVADTPFAEEHEWRQITEDDLAVPEEPSDTAAASEWANYRAKLAAYEEQKAMFGSLTNITNGSYQYFTAEICNDTNYVLRICSETNDAQRVAIDNVIVTEPVRASIEVLSVSMYPNDIPLGNEPVGFKVQLGNPRMNPTDIHVFADYYIGTNIWGVANWSVDPSNYKHIELEEDPEVPYLYRSSAGDMIEGLPVDSVVQYRIRVIYSGTFAHPIMNASFSNPSWYEPVDLNLMYGTTDLSTITPYYFVFSCPTGVVHINEFYAASPSHSDTYKNEFIEIIGPANLPMKGWKIDIVDGSTPSSIEDYVLDTYECLDDAILVGPENATHGWGFFVVGDDNGSVSNHINAAWSNPETRNLPYPGGIRLRRSMGAYVDRVSYGSESDVCGQEMVDRGYTWTGARSVMQPINRVRAWALLSKDEGDESVFDFRLATRDEGITPGNMNGISVSELLGDCPFTVADEFIDATAYLYAEYFDNHLPVDFLVDLVLNSAKSISSVVLDGGQRLELGTDYTTEVDPDDEGTLVVTFLAQPLANRNLSTDKQHTIAFKMNRGRDAEVVFAVRDSTPSGDQSTRVVPTVTGFAPGDNGEGVITLVFTNEDDGKTVAGWKWAIIQSGDLHFSTATTNEWTSLTDEDIGVEKTATVTMPDADAQYYKAVTSDTAE